jgi:hypothetical protein
MRVQRKAKVHRAAVDSDRHREAEASSKTLHAQVAVQCFAAQFTDAAAAAIADQALQQQLAVLFDDRQGGSAGVASVSAKVFASPLGW